MPERATRRRCAFSIEIRDDEHARRLMRRIAVVGFSIWLGATIALRVLGQFVFRDAGVGRILLVLLVSLPLMVLVARAVLAGLAPAERALGAIALVAPGMLLDTISTIWFARIFPN